MYHSYVYVECMQILGIKSIRQNLSSNTDKFCFIYIKLDIQETGWWRGVGVRGRDSSGSEQGQVAASYGHRNELSGFHKTRVIP